MTDDAVTYTVALGDAGPRIITPIGPATPATMADVMAALRHANEILKNRNELIAELEATLAWYGEQARLARLIHSEGDAGRQALAADGGERARAALTKSTG
jgi:uncharacterized protein (DUF2342 family)